MPFDPHTQVSKNLTALRLERHRCSTSETLTAHISSAAPRKKLPSSLFQPGGSPRSRCEVLQGRREPLGPEGETPTAALRSLNRPMPTC